MLQGFTFPSLACLHLCIRCVTLRCWHSFLFATPNTPALKCTSLEIKFWFGYLVIVNTLLIRMEHYFWSELHQNLWRTHVLHRFLRWTCVLHRYFVSGTVFLCLSQLLHKNLHVLYLLHTCIARYICWFSWFRRWICEPSVMT